MVIPILMHYKIFPSKGHWKVTSLRLYIQRLPAAYIHLSTNEKRRYVMMSGLRQYIAGYTVANLWRYPIRRHVVFASVLEQALFYPKSEHNIYPTKKETHHLELFNSQEDHKW